jgi:hypothetical protein
LSSHCQSSNNQHAQRSRGSHRTAHEHPTCAAAAAAADDDDDDDDDDLTPLVAVGADIADTDRKPIAADDVVGTTPACIVVVVVVAGALTVNVFSVVDAAVSGASIVALVISLRPSSCARANAITRDLSSHDTQLTESALEFDVTAAISAIA